MSTTAKFTVQEYDRIIASGAFGGMHPRHIELIRGELREMGPIGPEQADVVAWLTLWSARSAPPGSIGVRVQSPLALKSADSEPEPDILWVKPKRFLDSHPTPSDVLLLIEVADSSLDFDRSEKAKLYAEAGIQDYWIVNLVERAIEVRRDLEGGRYRSLRSFGPGEAVRPLEAPTARLAFDDVFNRQG